MLAPLAHSGGVDEEEFLAGTLVKNVDRVPGRSRDFTHDRPRIAEDRQYTEAAASPFPADASNLFNFLALRFSKSFSNDDGFLHCEQLLGVQNPVKLVMSKGVVVGAKIKLDPGPAAGPPQPNDASNQ